MKSRLHAALAKLHDECSLYERVCEWEIILPTKKDAVASFFVGKLKRTYAENEDPQPQVDCAFGFLITNCAPSKSSL